MPETQLQGAPLDFVAIEEGDNSAIASAFFVIYFTLRQVQKSQQEMLDLYSTRGEPDASSDFDRLMGVFF